MTRSASADLSLRAARMTIRVLGAAVLVFMIVPVLVLVPIGLSADAYLHFPPSGWSLQYYAQIARSPEWLHALGRSLVLGFATTVLSTVLGTLAALGLMRMQRWLQSVVIIFALAPLVMPIIVPAVGLFFMFNRAGIGSGFAALLVAHVLLATPLVMLIVFGALSGLHPSLERAAAGLGASPRRVLLTATLPAVAPGIYTAAVFAFMTSFDELVLALTLSGPHWRTLPVKMFDTIQYESGLATAAVGTLFIVLAAAALFASRRLSARRGRPLGAALSRVPQISR